MDILKGGKSPSSEPLLPVDAREKTASGSHSTPDNQQTKKMACARRLFLVSSLCLLVLLGFAAAGSALRVPCHKGHQSSPHASADSFKFSDLLKSASPSSLNDLLHQYFPEKFQKGVWPSEHEAVDAVHEEDAALATSIVRLAKRADGDNSTATTNPEPTDNSSSDPPVDPTTTPDIPSSSTVNQPTTTPDEPSSTSKPEPTTPESSTNSPSPPGTSSLSETTLLPTTSSFPETSSTSGPSSSFSETLPSSSIAGSTFGPCCFHTALPLYTSPLSNLILGHHNPSFMSYAVLTHPRHDPHNPLLHPPGDQHRQADHRGTHHHLAAAHLQGDCRDPHHHLQRQRRDYHLDPVRPARLGGDGRC